MLPSLGAARRPAVQLKRLFKYCASWIGSRRDPNQHGMLNVGDTTDMRDEAGAVV